MAGIQQPLGANYYGASSSAPYASPQHFALQQPPVRHRAQHININNASPHASEPPPQQPSQTASNNISMPPPLAQAPGTPKSPQSPGAQQGREQQRIALLFDINVELLQELSRLQNEGKGGATNPQQAMQLQQAGKPDAMASDEYIATIRRVQANLGYLMPKAHQDPMQQAKVPPGPAHMTPPAHMTQLQEKYAKLRELFPSWQGLDHRASGSGASSSPRTNAPNGMTAPQSANTPTQN